MKDLFYKIRDWIKSLFGGGTPTPTPVPVTNPVDLTQLLRGVVLAVWTGITQDQVKAYRAAKVTDLWFEVMEYIITCPAGKSVLDVLKSQIDRLVPIKAWCDAAGLPFGFVFNSNDDLNGVSNTQDRLSALDYALAKFGKCLCQPWSETRQWGSIDGNAIRRYAVTLGFQTSQYVGTGVSGRWSEQHPCSTPSGVSGGAAMRYVFDCTPMMTDTNAGIQPGATGVVMAGGASVALYGTLPSNSPALAAQCYGGAVVTPVTPTSDAWPMAGIVSSEGAPGLMSIAGTVRIVGVALTGITVHADLPDSWNEGPGTIAKCMIAVVRNGAQIGQAHYWEWLATAANHADSFRQIDDMERKYLYLQAGDTIVVWMQSKTSRTPSVIGTWPA